MEKNKILTFSIITFLFLTIISTSVFSATLNSRIIKNDTFIIADLTLGTVSCTDAGEISYSLNWGSYNDCKTNGQGNYTSQGYISGSLTCTQNDAPPVFSSTTPITFCSAPDCSRKVVKFCDVTKPSLTNFIPPQGWFNGDFNIIGNYTDNFRVYSILFSYKNISNDTFTYNESICDDTTSVNCTASLFINTSICNVQGSETCNVRAKSLDYWNNQSDYSYANYSIDFIPPEEPTITIDDSNPYVYYNKNTNTLYYTNNTDVSGYPQGNFTITVTVKDNTSNTTEVSGIYSINFPNFFGTGEQTYTYGTFRETMPLQQTQSHTYTIASNSNNQGTLTITVTDSAGNTRTKTINVVLDNQPPTNIPPIESLLQYQHQIQEYDHDTITFNIDYGSTTDSGTGLNHSNIYVDLANGTQDPIYKTPTCEEFETPTFNVNRRILENVDSTINTISYTDSTVDLLKNGFCHKFYIEVCDRVSNCAKVYPTNNQNIYGQDSTDGNTKKAACTVFSTYDNCNNRAKYFNGSLATVSSLIGDCSGTCTGGKVEYQNLNTNAVEPSYNNRVEILGQINGKDFYSYTNKSGDYIIYNISPVRSYQLRAYPNESQIFLDQKTTSAYNFKETQTILGDNVYRIIDNINFLLGLNVEQCTNSCTINNDPTRTCYSACIESTSSCGKDENNNIDVEKQKYLNLCNGKKAGTRIIDPENPDQYIECCQGPIIKKPNAKIKLEVENADNILKTERVVYYKGRLVRLVVAVFK